MATKGQQLAPGTHTRDLTVDKRDRSYLVHVPQHSLTKTGWPIVLAFHGSGTNAEAMLEFSQLNRLAEQKGFVVVYPNGTGRTPAARSFHAGNCCGYAMRQQVNDVHFVSRLLDELGNELEIAPGQVFATGMSNGAVMCYELAARLAHRLTAIAPVAGPMGSDTCAPSCPVSVCHFHGTADAFAPYHGGRGKRSISKTNFFSVRHSIHQWVQANACDPTPERRMLPIQVDDGTHVAHEIYSRGNQGSAVELYTIEGGGHTWPGVASPLKILGKTTQNLSANDVMWDFFQRHAKRRASS